MSTTTERPVRNGVDTAVMFATLDAIKAQPTLACVPVPGPEPLDRRLAQPDDDQATSTQRARRTAPAPRRS